MVEEPQGNCGGPGVGSPRRRPRSGGSASRRTGAAEVQRRRALLSNSIMFPVYYVLFACAWLLIWSLNILA